jgi:hypothetical protein
MRKMGVLMVQDYDMCHNKFFGHLPMRIMAYQLKFEK